MNKQQEPRLRFKGFTEVWQEKVLGEFVKSLDAGVSVNSEDILPDSDEFSVLKTSCLSSGIFDKNERKRVLSQTEIKRLKEELKDNSILMSRMNTPNLVGLSAYIEKAPKNTFLPDRLWQLKINNEQASTEWLAYYLSKPENLFRIQDNATGTSNSMKNITKNDVFQFEFLAPSLPEQTHLGNFFRRLDSQIAESRAVLEKSRQLKKAMLAKMFPENGEKIPKIRFKGFEGEWETRSLRDVLEIERKGKAQYQKLQAGNLPYLDAEFLNGGVKILTDAVPDVDVDDILIIWDGSNAGKVYTGFNGVLGSTLKSYRTNADCSSMFLYQELFRNEEVIFSQYRTPNIPHVIKDFSDEYNFLMPSYKEQTAIGNFFRQLDETIALQSAEVEKLNQLKKGLLAAMLV
ncbi:restriction endonuclease subunit S [Eikenella corrodens]|uniref:restriction endonuclease subunit S n=1 Tax=Eikenella corrodens TaxID=539 RepID=UPI0012AD0FB3|nr:restriction endonuclease subunit S [Eikenella corrodens]